MSSDPMTEPKVCINCGVVKGCINCGATDDGGYETEEVGSFCSMCWEYLREHFAASPAEQEPEQPPCQ